MTNQIIAYYLIIFNIVTFLVYGIDKWKAKKSLLMESQFYTLKFKFALYITI